MQPKLVAVVGPTGTGKSDLALDIAESLSAAGAKAEIVNSDSMQFYRGMDIGTAKLELSERRGIEHHMLDVLDPLDESTAAEYQRVARPIIEELQAKGVVPILVGGSMLYVAAVLNTFEFPARDEALRAELEADLERLGSHELHRRLAALDPVAASRVDPANPRRVVRALEIVLVTGQPFAAALPEEPESWQPVLEIGLNSDRANLVGRLETRVQRMWQKGLLDEVESLIPLGLREGKTSSRAIGYAQALSQLDGLSTQEEAIAETVRLTQRYARRQMSWFRRDKRIQWFDYQDEHFRARAIESVHRWLEA
ncbi:MAG: tRNA (adenosine(37)-N6)-dimethylallyltransferase MiaA [Actinomycetales bacterium]|nr:tRNA (adenosine(37)-N6)-dimethylallyltransferase MiaA [Actinomycetales bacterium]